MNWLKTIFLRFNGFINVLKCCVRKFNFVGEHGMNTTNANETCNVIQKIFSIIKGSRTYYNTFTTDDSKHKYCNTWEEKLNIEIKWNTVFENIHGIKELKLKWFQIRLVTRILGTNISLYNMNIRQDNLCTFCNNYRESIQHIFTECIHVNVFWNVLLTMLKNLNCINRSFVFNDELKLFGTSATQKMSYVCSYVFLVARFYVYKSRCEAKKPNILSFLRYLTEKYYVIRFIAIKNLKIESFEQEWADWIPMLLN